MAKIKNIVLPCKFQNEEDKEKTYVIYMVVTDDTFAYVGKSKKPLYKTMGEHYIREPEILIDLYIQDAKDVQVYVLEECPNNDIILDAAETVQIRRIQRMLVEGYGKEDAQKMLKNKTKVVW